MKKKLKIFIDGLYVKNPVLSLFLGLTLAVLATTCLSNAVVISLIVLVSLVITEFVISLLRNKIDHFVSCLIAILICAFTSTLVSFLLAAFYPSIGLETYSDYSNTLVTGVVPFAAVSSIYLFKGKEALTLKPGEALADSIGSGLGFLFALCLIAFFREILATGELAFSFPDGTQGYVHLFDFTIPFLAQPFGGLLFTGLFSGFHGCVVGYINNKRLVALQKGE